VRADAPVLPPRGQDRDSNLVIVQPPFGTNPPQRPVVPANGDLSERLIWNDPRELWYLALPSKLSPKQVLQILRSALGGDIWQQWQLLSLMLDSWPTLRKCSHEIRQAVSMVRYIVRPWTEEEGEEATDDAKERADLVSRGMRNMKPDPTTDEKGFTGMVYDLTDAMLNGLTMSELMWWEKNGEILPRASAWVHPRHFTFGNNGKLAVFDSFYNRLNFTLAQSPGLSPDQNKFLIAQFMSRSGSSLGAGLMRPLAWDWSAVIYNREWMLGFAQKYGNPFLDLAYKAGATQDEVQKLNALAANASSQGWLTHPDLSTVTIHPAQSLGADNPQVHIMKLADEHCMELLLGQSSTTKQVPGKLGNSDTQDKVKREMVQGIAAFIAEVLTTQFASAICRLNYWDDDMCPTVVADFTEPNDPLEEAQRDQVFLQAGVPMNAEEFYQRHNMVLPETGDMVMVGGKLGVLGDTSEEVSAQGTPPPSPDGTDGFGQGDQGPNADKPAPGIEAVDVKPSQQLRKLLASATDQELAELNELLVKAKAAQHRNGEAKAVEIKIKQIKTRVSGRRKALK
jgi:phage gp29-like protein